ncbi:MAG: hypothetical protein ACPL7D_07085 [Candidatus Sumerlaeaceae bacterium]|jgi:hypothetical protein
MRGRYPFLDPVRGELLKAKWIWVACCFSPIIYFFLARAVEVWSFRDAAKSGLVGLDPENRDRAAKAFFLFAVSLEAAVLSLRHWFNRRARSGTTTLQEVMSLYLKRTIVLLAVSECAVLGGFVYFLLFGDMRALLIGGVLTYLYYAQSYPSEEGLARLAEPLRRARGGE